MAEYLLSEIERVSLPSHEVEGTIEITVNIQITHNGGFVYQGQAKLKQNQHGNFPDINSITPPIDDPSTNRRVIAELKNISDAKFQPGS